MCDCKKNIEERLLARFKEMAPEAKEHRAKLSGYALIFGDAGLKQMGCMTIELAAAHPLKSGGFKSKTERSNMIFTFCPFCGEKYEKGGA